MLYLRTGKASVLLFIYIYFFTFFRRFQSMREFLHDYDNKKGPRPLSPYATTTYDSMWAIALTLKGSLEYWQNGSDIGGQNDILQSFTYERGAEIRNIFFDVMQNLEFLGISVRLKKRTVFLFLSQTTDFKLFQTQRVYRRQF